MTAAGAIALPETGPMSSQTVLTIDYLANLFLDLERKASEKYLDAYVADEPLEQLRSRLIDMVLEIGRALPDGSKVMRGADYAIELTFGASNFCDPDAVRDFRYALIRHRAIPKGILPEIFAGTVQFKFRESAKRVIDRLNLPAELLEQYEQCRSKTPILVISPCTSQARQ